MVEVAANPLAVEKIRAKTPIGSPLNSAEWADIPLALRERAQFSSKIENLRFLQRVQDRVTQAVEMIRRPGEGKDGGDGAYQTREKFVAEMRKIAMEEGLDPRNKPGTADRAGTLRDPTSERRLKLIYDQQTQSAQEYARWKAEQDPDVLAAFPAQEFLRVEIRKVPRINWGERWTAAGGQAIGGRMIALKNDPVWTKLSRFGTPYPPFDYGSGMGLRDVSRKEAEELGLIKPGETPVPAERKFNEDLQASVTDLNPTWQMHLKDTFKDQISIKNGVAKWKAQPSKPAPKPKPAPAPTPKPTPAPAPQPKPPIPLPPKPVPVPGPSPVPPAPPSTPTPAPAPSPATLSPSAPTPTLAPVKNPPAKLQPSGSPVAKAVKNAMDKSKKHIVDETIAAVDSVHGDGPLKPIDFNHTVSARAAGTYYSNDTLAASIGVRKRGDGAHLTLGHEVGHWIDHMGIQSATKFASESGEPIMRAWKTAVENSNAIKKLRAMNPSAYLQYTLRGREIWARAYAQFIATESGNKAMLKRLDEVRTGKANYLPESQWDDADFAPIAQAMRELFSSLGWMKGATP